MIDDPRDYRSGACGGGPWSGPGLDPCWRPSVTLRHLPGFEHWVTYWRREADEVMESIRDSMALLPDNEYIVMCVTDK